jgi:methyl acetate hydrolase
MTVRHLLTHTSGFGYEFNEPRALRSRVFNLPADKQSRVATQFQRKDDGTLARQPAQPSKPSEFFSGGGGLHSTAADYLTFVQALLAGGQVGQRRILAPESVAMMGKNQIGDLTMGPIPSLLPQFIRDRAILPGALDKFGLGFALNTASVGTDRGANTMSWAGVFNTFFWIDREKQIGAVLMSQMLPFLDPGPQKLLEDFDRAVYAWRRARSDAQ